ncbi:MAG: hypothetical protein U9Q34_08000 [Elusimicrobiota bacterium]|nr:hypothetical protein [Elusimicrobiota bacterium]
MPVIMKAMPLFKRVPKISKNLVMTTRKIIATPQFILFSLNSFEPLKIRRSPANKSAMFAEMAKVFMVAISVDIAIGKNINIEPAKNILTILLCEIFGMAFKGVKKIKPKEEIAIKDEDIVP